MIHLFALMLACASSQSGLTLDERFVDPPMPHHILKIIHSWPDAPDQQDALIEKLVAQGFGGVVCNVSFQEYLESETRWDAFVRAVRAARQAGMNLWLYDEKGYPSGVAGGLTLRDHPEFEAFGLLLAEAITTGDTVDLELPPGRLILATAFEQQEHAINLDVSHDLSQHITDGKLVWSPPAGEWHVLLITESVLYEGTHAQLSLADKLPYINLLQPEATQRFIEVTHERYAEHLGSDLGVWFEATFTDEPSLMSMFLRPMPYRILPWSAELAAIFQERRGYSIIPHLPALFVSVGGQERAIRYDFWQTVSELVADGFFGQIERWCDAHGLPSGGHLLAEESIAAHVPLYGDFFRCLRRLSAPSIDCLTSLPGQVPWFVAKLAGSAATLEGHTLTMCETSDHSQVYRPAGDSRPRRIVTEAEIRGTLNRLYVGGINTITSYYSFRELSDEELRRLNKWAGRCGTMLREGHLVTDIAVLYPAETMWSHHEPAHQWGTNSPQVAQVESVFRAASDALYAAGRDFIYVDSQAIADASVQDGALVHGDLRWRVLVLPCVDTLPATTWDKLVQFWQSGGIVIALGALPINTETAFPSTDLQAKALTMFGSADKPTMEAQDSGGVGAFLPVGTESLLPAVLDRLIEPDVQVLSDPSPIRVTHRRQTDGDLYFLINDSGEPWQGQVRLAGVGDAQRMDPATGSISPIEGNETLSLTFEPYGAWFLRFTDIAQPRKHHVENGALAAISVEPIHEVEPDVGQGEFVESELATEPRAESTGNTVWQATGMLTKSDVDTFLFLIFRYPESLDLSDAEMLALDTWVPENQQTPTQLLVILRDKDGADYLANAGRQLSTSGYARTFLSLDRFQLAGWSADPSGKLELDKVAAISIGWGGYYGKEGEVVRFSVAVPGTVRSYIQE